MNGIRSLVLLLACLATTACNPIQPIALRALEREQLIRDHDHEPLSEDHDE